MACYLLHTGFCSQQHTDGQSARCLRGLGSLTVDAVSLILNSWTFKRGKNYQRGLLASPGISPALCFFIYLSCKHVLKEKAHSLPPQSPLYSLLH